MVRANMKGKVTRIRKFGHRTIVQSKDGNFSMLTTKKTITVKDWTNTTLSAAEGKMQLASNSVNPG